MMDFVEQRKCYYRFFEGIGIDVGPFNKPFFDNPSQYNVEVKYCDHCMPEELKMRFPEIKDLDPVTPHFICDVSKEGLSFTNDEAYDFVIFSHLIEHMANPFFSIKDAFRVLKTGGVLYISAPDCRFSDDQGRPKSTWKELESLFLNDVREIADSYVLAYLKSPVISKIPWVQEVLRNPKLLTKEVFDNERKRSFHVHVWDRTSFFQHVAWFLLKYQFPFTLLDLAVYENNSYENIIVLRKAQTYSAERLFQDITNLYRLRSKSKGCDLGKKEEEIQ